MSDPEETMRQWRDLALEDVRLAHAHVEEARQAMRDARALLRARAANARKMGVTLAEVGGVMGVSRQRVHGMLK
jgi:hypothetical protein